MKRGLLIVGGVTAGVIGALYAGIVLIAYESDFLGRKKP